MKRSMPLSWALIITAVVAIGIAAAWGAGSAWILAFVHQARGTGDAYENIYTSVDGEPVIVRMTRNSQATERVLTLTGEEKKLTTQDLLHPQYVYGAQTPIWMQTAGDWVSRIVASNDGGVPPVYWYLIHDGRPEGRAYGVGYHPRSKRIVGYFSRRGFGDALPPREDWFEIAGHHALVSKTTLNGFPREPTYANGQPYFLLLADAKLWMVDLAHRELKVLFDCPAATQVGQAWWVQPERPPEIPGVFRRSASEITPLYGLVRQPESVTIIEPITGNQRTYKTPAEIDRLSIAASELADGNLLLFATDWQEGRDHDVYWLNPAGEVLKHQHARLASWTHQSSLAESGWYAAISAPMPVSNLAFTGLMPLEITASGKDDTYGEALRSVVSQTWPSMLAVLVVAGITATVAYRRQRRFGLPHAGAWAAFAFLFGVPGLLAYRFHRAWPVLEECPACHQPAPRDRTACLDCGASFPPPSLKGTEVFA
jgi:hypothetical protein